MNAQELKKSAIENNIKTIQKRIQELEQSFDSVNKELSVDEEPNDYEGLVKAAKEPIPQVIEKSFSKARSEQAVPELRSNFKRLSKRREEEEPTQVTDNFETRKMIEGLLREIDILRENEKQADVRIETLTFRCEKLQTELTVKLDLANKLTTELDEKNMQIKTLLGQIKGLEAVIDQNKRSLVPDLQRLKGQYDIALLEIRSLENDNVILENRIRDLTEANTKIRDEKREIDAKNRQIEIERLTLKKEIEELKSNFMNHESELEDTNEKYERVVLENDRLKNEVLYLNQRNKILTQDPDNPNESLLNVEPRGADGRADYSDILKPKTRQNDGTLDNLKVEVERRLRPTEKQATMKDPSPYNTGVNRLLNPEAEKLNFESLALIGERMKRLNK